MIEIDLTNVKTNEYKNFKLGSNKCYIADVALKKSMSGNKMLEVKLKDAEDATLIDKIVLTDKAKWRVQQFLKACQLPHKGKISIDEKQLISRHLIVDCIAESYKKQDGTDGTAIKVKTYMVDNDYGYADPVQAEPALEEQEEDIPL